MSVTYPYFQIFWQCVWRINIIKYSDNVCDISISTNILTMSVTYLHHQIFLQCLWHTLVFNSSDRVRIISQVCFIYPICNCQNPNPTSRFFASPLGQYSLYLHATQMAKQNINRGQLKYVFIMRPLNNLHACLLHYPNGEAKSRYFLPRHRGSVEGKVYKQKGDCLHIHIIPMAKQ